jgi:uncharacterized RDD family membrane protein YckC
MSDANPYAAPIVMSSLTAPNSDLRIASQTQRFLTWLLDNIVLYVINYVMGFSLTLAFIAINGPISPSETSVLQLIATLIGLVITFAYFVIMESTTSVTLGKLVMGTKVVSNDGSKPTFSQILGRSACRFIPFEAFSFFGNKGFPIGWHDSIPGTKVIKTR